MMTRLNSLLAISASLLLATACSQNPTADNSPAPVSETAKPPATTNQPATKPTQTAMNAPKGTSGAATEVKAMQDVVSKTTAAVGKKDFATAQTEFAKLEGHWSKVEDSVKQKSADAYKKVEAETTAVKNSLKSKNQTKSITALQSLGKTIAAFPPQITAK